MSLSTTSVYTSSGNSAAPTPAPTPRAGPKLPGLGTALAAETPRANLAAGTPRARVGLKASNARAAVDAAVDNPLPMVAPILLASGGVRGGVQRGVAILGVRPEP